MRMPGFEPPDETDWSDVTNALTYVARDSDLSTASQLRDRLAVLAAEYAPRASNVDVTILRRDCHALLDSTIRRHQHAWQMLDGIHRRACDALRAEITSGDSARSLCLDRNAALGEFLHTVSDTDSVIVSGESALERARSSYWVSPLRARRSPTDSRPCASTSARSQDLVWTLRHRWVTRFPRSSPS